jgi:Na+/proline symporter
MISYFGTDQSQVQRYLTAKSVDEARTSLLISAYWKIPLQALILIVGVLVFVFYLFRPGPLLYNPAQEAAVRAARPAEYASLEQRFETSRTASADAAREIAADVPGAVEKFRELQTQTSSVRTEALALAATVTGAPSRDVNYIIPRFVLHELPLGLAGLFIAGVMAAAMSSIAAELNSLSTATVIDFYRRWFKPEATEAHYLRVSKVATGIWGVFACIVATYAAGLGSLIEVVNRFGSFFYGSILGVFLLAMTRRARPSGAFVGLLTGMLVVGAVSFGAPKVSFLWHNVIGALTVLITGMAISLLSSENSDRSPP